MKGLFFLLFCFILIVRGDDELNATYVNHWMNAVEEIISHISLGSPLKADFTPDYVAKRTLAFTIKKQTNAFRALVASTIIRTSGTEAHVCIDSTQTDEAVVRIIVAELKEREFDVLWLHSVEECVGRAALLIKLPPPNEQQ